MTEQNTFITKEGLKSLEEELVYLKTKKRREVADRIQEAKELGDLSENAEYSEAKEEYAFIEGKIQELEHLLKHVTVIKKQKGDTVSVGSTIGVKLPTGKEAIYTIVGASEADPSKGLISNESPIGQAFLGHKSGEKVSVPTPRGDMEYEILSVE